MDPETPERVQHLEASVERLEMPVTRLYTHLNLELPIASADDGLSLEVRALVDGGKKKDAIKLHRKLTAAGLGEAKEAVEAYERTHRR